MAALAEGNEGQAIFWSEAGGEAWVALQDQMDRQLSGVGAAALAALRAQPGEAILDVGCGCGATLLDLAAAVGEAGRVIGLDISVPMTALASRRLAEGGHAHARAMVGDAQIATGVDIGGPVDAVYSRFGVMFFVDPVAAFKKHSHTYECAGPPCVRLLAGSAKEPNLRRSRTRAGQALSRPTVA